MRLMRLGELERMPAQFQLRHDVPGQHAQGLLLIHAQLPRHLVDHAERSQAWPSGVTSGSTRVKNGF